MAGRAERGARRSVVAWGMATALAVAGVASAPASSGEAPPGPAIAGAEASAAAAAKAPSGSLRPTGSLRVRFVRPAEAAALGSVKITGPRQSVGGKKFKRTLRRTTLLPRLVPGTYRVTATSYVLRDQRIVPRLSHRTVRIPARRVRKNVTVTYGSPVHCATRGSRLLAWGENAQGQLGVSGRSLSTTPVVNPWLFGATRAVGTRSSVHALCADGTVWSWGSGASGQLGIDRTGDRLHPVKVVGLTDVTAIAAGTDSVVALRRDGSVWAWGSGRYGQLGNGTSGFGVAAAKPVRVALPGAAKAIAVGGYTAYAVSTDNKIWVWGNTATGQRGDGTATESTATPVASSYAGDSVVAITAAQNSVRVLDTAGRTTAWGGSNQGEIGSSATYLVPTPVSTGVALIGASQAAHYEQSAAAPRVTTAWGSGRHIDLGAPPVERSAVVSALAGVELVQIAGAGYTAYALDTSGRVWSWGSHQRGQAGRGGAVTGSSQTDGLLPAPVAGLDGSTSIGAGLVNGFSIR